MLDWRIQGSTCGQGRLVPTDFWNGHKLELLSSKRCSLLLTPFSVATFVDGVGVFLVTTADGLFSIDLDSDRATKVCEGREINNVVPYVSCSTGTTLLTSLSIFCEMIKKN